MTSWKVFFLQNKNPLDARIISYVSHRPSRFTRGDSDFPWTSDFRASNPPDSHGFPMDFPWISHGFPKAPGPPPGCPCSTRSTRAAWPAARRPWRWAPRRRSWSSRPWPVTWWVETGGLKRVFQPVPEKWLVYGGSWWFMVVYESFVNGLEWTILLNWWLKQ